MRENKRHKQHPRLIRRRTLQPLQRPSHNSIIIIHRLLIIPQPLIKQPLPDIFLVLGLRLPAAREPRHELGRLEKPVLVQRQLRHRGRKGIPPRREARDVVTPLFLERTKQVGLPRLDEVLEGAVTRDVRVVAREHAAAGLRADGGLDEAVCEAGALGREAVNVGRLYGLFGS